MSQIPNYIGKTFIFTFLILMLINILGFVPFKMEIVKNNGQLGASPIRIAMMKKNLT